MKKRDTDVDIPLSAIGKARAYFFLAFLTRLGVGAIFLGSKNGHLCKAQACSAGILATAKR